MLSAISNASAIATLILFILYFMGKTMKIMRIKSTLCEEYRLDEKIDEAEIVLPYYVKIGSGYGYFFSVSSPNGFKSVDFYEADLDVYTKTSKGKLIKSFNDIMPNEKVYARVDIPDATEACYVEIEKYDYVKISFGIADYGYDGHLVKTNYKIKMPLKAWIYYLCS